MKHNRSTILILLVCSVLDLILGPVIILMGALSANVLFIGGALIIIGALGLYAGMKALDSETEREQGGQGTGTLVGG